MKIPSKHRVVRILFCAQLTLFAIAMPATLLAPPAEGLMLAVPVAGGSNARLINWVIAGDGRIAGDSPVPGAVLIYGKREMLMGAAISHGTLLIGLPNIMCGRDTSFNWR